MEGEEASMNSYKSNSVFCEGRAKGLGPNSSLSSKKLVLSWKKQVEKQPRPEKCSRPTSRTRLTITKSSEI